MTEQTLKPLTISIPEGETVGKHAFPWKASEIVGLAIVAAIGLGIMVVSKFALGSLFFGGVMIATVPYFIWLSNSRKKSSLISVVQDGTIWMFTRKGIHDSSDSNVAVDISKIARIDMVDHTGMPNAIVLVEEDDPLTGHKALMFPQRLLKDPSFKGRISALAQQPNVKVSKRAAEALGTR